jgi:uncharacterized protein YqjF (DUF2071 family)
VSSSPRPISASRPEPVRRWWLRNRWEELAFLHWAYDPEIVQRLLPDGLRVDTFDGCAYVSLIPFRMADAAPRGLPAAPWLSTFAETNVRTYVVDSRGNRAIWFHSLEASRLPVVAFARWALGFPYVWGDLTIEASGARRSYETIRRRWPADPASRTRVVVDVGPVIAEPSELDHFLTARWGTVAQWRGRLRHHPVDHPPWRLHDAGLVELDDTSIEAAGLPAPQGSPLVRWAEPIPARFGAPVRV